MARFDTYSADNRSPLITAAKEFLMLTFWLGSLFGLMVVGHGMMGA